MNEKAHRKNGNLFIPVVISQVWGAAQSSGLVVDI